ncbi:uncharacterized protein LOC132910580 [Bombus pascuorum]|uniref:uncharacterized protein LOC132910580 n=1 Tax=Bombus pascuorum TaxID=65598 RepID=UPI00298E016D|nr:uncharacterized protein LOC132910580 [Bombus pascuorum]
MHLMKKEGGRRKKKKEKNMDMKDNQEIDVYGAGEGYPSTGAGVGGQAGPTASLASDRGRVGVGHRAPIRVNASGEEMEDVAMEETREGGPPARTKANNIEAAKNRGRSGERKAERAGPVDRRRSDSRGGKPTPTPSLAPLAVPSTPLPTAAEHSGNVFQTFKIPKNVRDKVKAQDGHRSIDGSIESSRMRKESTSDGRSEDEESMASVTARGKKRKITKVTPEVSDRLRNVIQGSSPRDVDAEVRRHQAEVLKVAATSSNLKGTYVKTLKDAVEYTVAAWSHQTTTSRVPDFLEERKKREALEREVESLKRRNEELEQRINRFLKGTAETAAPSPTEAQAPRSSGRAKDDIASEIEMLKKSISSLGPSLLGTLREELREALRGTSLPRQATGGNISGDKERTTMPRTAGPKPPQQSPQSSQPSQQQAGQGQETDGEWRTMVSRKARRKAREQRRKEAGHGAPLPIAPQTNRTRSAVGPAGQPPRTTPAALGGGERRREGNGEKKAGAQPAKRTYATVAGRAGSAVVRPALRPPPTSSAVTLTLREGAPKTYEEILAEARRDKTLQKCGLEYVRTRKAATGAMVINIPDDAGMSKATQLASRLAGVLDPSTVRVSVPVPTAEIKLVGVDISLNEEELLEELSRAADCQPRDVRAWSAGTSRSGMGIFYAKCPVAGARKLAQAGRVTLGWTRAKVIALPRRPLQCFRCLEVGHMAAMCVSPVRRTHLCFRCGEEGHRARNCTAASPRCPICEAKGAPSKHRMGSAACKPPEVGPSGRRRARRTAMAKAAEATATTTSKGVTGAAEQASLSGNPPVGGKDSTIGCNLGRAGRAQDLLYQSIRESRTDVAVVAEPYNIPASPQWAGDLSGWVAITWPCTSGVSGRIAERGNGFVAVEWTDLVVVGVYISPNCDIRAFEDLLDEMGECVRRLLPRQVLVLGDFNAHSTTWGNDRTTTRGRELADWAAGLGLVLVNRGSESTYVGRRGASVIDLTWATQRLHPRIRNWRVAVEMETLADHLYVLMDIEPAKRSTSGDNNNNVEGRTSSRPGLPPPRRWKLKERDGDMLRATATVAAWCWDAKRNKNRGNVDGEAQELGEWMRRACDASMPRTSAGSRRDNSSVYWWSREIADLRDDCHRARRLLARARRRGRNRNEEEILERYRAHREARMALQRAIKEAKEASWKRLLESVESDPWGRPYKTVLRKLRPAAPPITENMDRELLARVIDTLFPRPEEEGGEEEEDSPRRHEDTEQAPPEERGCTRSGGGGPAMDQPGAHITREELEAATKKMAAKDVAPGPDGIPGRVWAETMDIMAPRLLHLYNRCLREGAYPRAWKVARLVLLRKEGRPPESPSAYRPICLLDEVGKLFERVIASRLGAHMESRVPGWHDNQFGFRRGRSTIDAIRRLREGVERVVAREGIAIAVSLDITNAFNSIPWSKIREALRFFEVPGYLRRIIGAYLRERWITYRSTEGEERRAVERGVPQGSVLGPMLWITAYDYVLRTPMPGSTGLICYADDTLVVAGGRWWYETAEAATEATRRAARAIGELGLKVTPAKTEALGFYDGRRRGPPPDGLTIDVDGVGVRVGSQLRYLGLIIDDQWSFEPHFESLAPKVAAAANALCGILPNIGGAGRAVRRLYDGVVRARAMYGAPIWARDLAASRRSQALLRAVQRTTALRIARGYRTVSHASATVLAASPPYALQALALQKVYGATRVRDGDRDEDPLQVRKEIEEETWERWRLLLEKEARKTSHRAVDAVLPVWDRWKEARGVPLTYRLTQVLTGHGVFGEFLKKIRKEVTNICHHCGEAEDSAQHTLQHCPAWAMQRHTLTVKIGDDLSPRRIVEALLRSRSDYEAVRDFCEQIMLAKERAERLRVRAEHPARIRRERSGRNGGRPPSPPTDTETTRGR